MYKPFFVGVVGFEPTTPCSQSRCANRTALYPEFYFKRTPIPWRSFLLKQEYANRLVRRSIREGVACPPKPLSGGGGGCYTPFKKKKIALMAIYCSCGERGIRTPGTLTGTAV